MDSFQIGIVTGMIVIVVLIIFFIHSFRNMKKKVDIIEEVMEKMKGGKES